MDVSEWEQQIDQQLDEIRGHGRKLAKATAAVRGRAEARGVSVEVDLAGDITNLQIAPAAMRWANTQMTAVLLDCHQRARADAKKKLDRLLQRTDPRLRDQYSEIRKSSAPAAVQPARPPTGDQIQAADDAYFARRNLDGGWTDH